MLSHFSVPANKKVDIEKRLPWSLILMTEIYITTLLLFGVLSLHIFAQFTDEPFRIVRKSVKFLFDLGKKVENISDFEKMSTFMFCSCRYFR